MKTRITIIGAGIIGCSLAYKLAEYDFDITVLEKSSYVASGATKANSAMLHEGLSTKRGTMRDKLVRNGHVKLKEVMDLLNVDYKPGAGLITLAFNHEEIAVLEEQVRDAVENGLDARIISRDELLELEPNVNPEAVGAFYSKSVSIISPYELCIAMAENAALNGVRFVFDAEVTDIRKECNRVKAVVTAEKEYETDYVIDAAGINADKIAGMVEAQVFFIRPRKGEYYIYDKEYGSLVSHVISVIGNAQSKGMIVLPTMHGNLLAGSSAAMIEDKEDTSTNREVLDDIYRDAVSRICPALKRNEGIVTVFSGLRAVSNTEDFIIDKAKTVTNFIWLAGIQSPGMSSCMNIAEYVIDIMKQDGIFDHVPVKRCYKPGLPKRKKIIEIDENEANRIIAGNADYGEIVCRCESVTKGEIIEAIHGIVPAVTVDAVKRKLRCGMGRCQGGFCLQRIIGIIHRETGIPMTEIRKDYIGSGYLLEANRKEAGHE